MPNILLVEDDIHINNINRQTLTNEGFSVLCVTTVRACLEALNTIKFDLIVLDVNLPDGDGLQACKEIRQKYNIPILFLTAMGENSDIVKGFDCGGDDYITKPYDLSVFIARIKARLRVIEPLETIRIGNLHLDSLSSIAYCNGVDLLLTRREFLLLWILAVRKGLLINRDELYHKVWGSPSVDNYNSLRILVSRVKTKLTEISAPITIANKRQEGYFLQDVKDKKQGDVTK